VTRPRSTAERDDAARRRIERAAAIDWTPAEIAERLAVHVVGQDEAVRAASVALYQHVRTRVHRVAKGLTDLAPVRIPPIMFIGPTGCGKSQLMRAAARLTGLPAYVGDASALTAEGWHGANTGDWVRALINEADGHVPLAQVGMLMVDEIDKRAARSVFGGRDISGADAQDSLLRLLDSGHVEVEAIDNVNGLGQRVRVPVRVDSMLVWTAGAFSGGGGCDALLDIVARRLKGRRKLGFGAAEAAAADPSPEDLRRAVTPADLMSYGLKVELVGRLRVVVMSDLSADAMRRILCDVPDGPIQTVQGIARGMGWSFEFARTLIDEIVRRATASGLGARALSGLVARATEAAWMKVPELMRDREKHPWGRTVVTLRRDSLETGWFGVRVETRRRKAAGEEPIVADPPDSGLAVG